MRKGLPVCQADREAGYGGQGCADGAFDDRGDCNNFPKTHGAL
jgi:hypothetical protein